MWSGSRPSRSGAGEEDATPWPRREVASRRSFRTRSRRPGWQSNAPCRDPRPRARLRRGALRLGGLRSNRRRRHPAAGDRAAGIAGGAGRARGPRRGDGGRAGRRRTPADARRRGGRAGRRNAVVRRPAARRRGGAGRALRRAPHHPEGGAFAGHRGRGFARRRPSARGLAPVDGRPPARREIARRIARHGLRGDYLHATGRSKLLNPKRYGAKGRGDLEGFLFPATYVLRHGAPVKQLVDRQLRAFKRAFRRVRLRAARRVNLTAYDVLTIASLVEREAQLPREHKLIASVIYNRLRARMQLGIDASVRFATGNWSRPLTDAELRDPSPYNTRLHVGLPPGPIGNPGLAAINAAAHPAHTKYLYFVVKPGTCGEHAFSKDMAQFERDAKRYQSARAANRGQSPTRCGKR